MTIIRRAIAQLRADSNLQLVAILALVTVSVILHAVAAVVHSLWFLPLDLLSSVFMMVGGGLIAFRYVWAEDADRADVWFAVTNNDVAPGPSGWAHATNASTGETYISDGQILVDPQLISAGIYEPTHLAADETPQVVAIEAEEQFGSNYPYLSEVHEEVLAQLDLWGEQNHPDGTGGVAARNNRTKAHNAVEAAAAADDGSLTWAMILREEFTEALAEEDLEKLDRELTQVAAVCVAWKHALTRRMAAAIGAEVDPE